MEPEELINKDCKYIDLEEKICRLTEVERGVPKFDSNCRCAECLVGLTRLRYKL